MLESLENFSRAGLLFLVVSTQLLMSHLPNGDVWPRELLRIVTVVIILIIYYWDYYCDVAIRLVCPTPSFLRRSRDCDVPCFWPGSTGDKSNTGTFAGEFLADALRGDP